MSQPDMYPEEVPREEPKRRALHRQREDLRAPSFPLGDWGEPAERLEELYRWAEAEALRTVDWYLADRVRKRLWARGLRVAAALAATSGAVLAVTGEGVRDRWAYAALLLAVVCVGLDRYLGLTAGWMRDVATAQAVQRRLEALRYDWAAESVREVLGPTEGTAAEAAERCLTVLRRFSEDVSELVRTETADWMLDFRAGGAPLRTQSLTWGWGARSPESGTPGTGGRFPLLPGGRPNMPRQRPPEGPRAG
ncbi:SLATT domain-containing protein [Streptomyces sp. NPDC058691]|uniref:SLATT domain-containing protein n=1 Tax=Streptomyces sp. NPDC058691 TaxID=3346601 RepID=UPI003652F3BC